MLSARYAVVLARVLDARIDTVSRESGISILLFLQPPSSLCSWLAHTEIAAGYS
jgi:hypothetical protein